MVWQMKTAFWLYIFMFVAFFDLHAQYPILSPYAISLGAAPSFIGFIMGIYSITHLPGNMLAGYGVDRFGSKYFISISLILAGILLLFQANVEQPWHLLVIRSISGFVLAFLSPASMALLAKLATDRVSQGKLMSGNGLVHTLASVVSPAAGAILVAKLGFHHAFVILGWILIGTGFWALFVIQEKRETSLSVNLLNAQAAEHPLDSSKPAASPVPLLFFAIPLALACSQGILFFEIPLMESVQESIMTSGLLFSIMSFGALVTLSMLFIHRFSAFMRSVWGCLSLALLFFGMAVNWPVPIGVSLFCIGMAKGIIYPALASFLAENTASKRYGKIFAFLSVAYSIGAFIGPVLSGMIRDSSSPYFAAFLALMIALCSLPLRFGPWYAGAAAHK
jgi:MFS family permease